jgi:hypothetical protein
MKIQSLSLKKKHKTGVLKIRGNLEVRQAECSGIDMNGA